MSGFARELPEDVERQLDDYLGSWARQLVLSEQEEDEIYSSITTFSRELGYEWWQSLFERISFPNKATSYSRSPWLWHRPGKAAVK